MAAGQATVLALRALELVSDPSRLRIFEQLWSDMDSGEAIAFFALDRQLNNSYCLNNGFEVVLSFSNCIRGLNRGEVHSEGEQASSISARINSRTVGSVSIR